MRCCGILVWTLDSRLYDPSSIPVIARGTFCPSARHIATLLLSTQVYKWVTGRMRKLFVAWLGMWAPLKWRLARMLRKELRWCTLSAGLILESSDRSNNTLQCKALWVVFHTIEKHYIRTSYYYYYLQPSLLWKYIINVWFILHVYMKSFIAKRVNSILVNLRYLRCKLLKYKENNI